MLCYLVYDIRNDPYQLVWVWGGLAVVAFGLIWSRIMRQHVFLRRSWLLIGGVLVTMVTTYEMVWQGYQLRSDVARGHYEIITGEISRYNAVPPGRKGDDSFLADGVWFHVSEYLLAPGFQQTRRTGSPLNEGTYVRLGFVDQTIVRLEICDPKARASRSGGR